jgi:aminoglycoside phosphotransferase (APT) family kinase protein
MVVERLLRLPVTLIHGEFYPSNVLVKRDGDRIRVCPVDWETAAIGPGLLDLAALTSGRWTEKQRLAMAMAYFKAVGADQNDDTARDEFLIDLDFCNLFMAIQWLGWSPDWRPPPEHAQNWLTEACRLATKLRL